MHLALKWLLVVFVGVISVMVKNENEVLLRLVRKAEGEKVKTRSINLLYKFGCEEKVGNRVGSYSRSKEIVGLEVFWV